MEIKELDKRELEQVSGGGFAAFGMILGVIGAMEPMYDVYRGFTENRR